MVDCYSIYGLKVHSQISLPLQSSVSKAVDIQINKNGSYHFPQEDDSCHFYFSVGPQEALFHFKDLAVFAITDGHSIKVAPANSSIDTELLANTLLGTPMGIVLLQRGGLVLHASAVEICGKVVCFLGISGAGKSTTVCSLIQAGHKLVTDDVVAITFSNLGNPSVLPGYPWMKMDPQVALRLGVPPDQLIQLDATSIKKRYLISTEKFSVNPGRLAGIYFLNWGQAFALETIKAQQSILDLMVHAYGFSPKLAYPTDEAKRFLQYAQLVRLVPCFNLFRPRNITQLNTLTRLIEEHAEQL